MKKILIALMVLTVAVLSFWAGGRYGEQRSAGTGPQGALTRADKIEDVQADSEASSVPGAVTISPDRQQLIGVKVAAVEKKPMTYTLRLYGRVVPDETKIYRVNASTDCWIRETVRRHHGKHRPARTRSLPRPLPPPSTMPR